MMRANDYAETEFKETEVGPIPADWDLKTIDEVMEVVYRYPSYYGIDYVDMGVPEIRGELLGDFGEINAFYTRFISHETAGRFPKTELQEGDIVMSVRGTMGKIGFVRPNLAGAQITANLMRLSPNPDIADSEYLKHYFLWDGFSNLLDKLSPQTTIKTIQSSILKSIPVPLPPLPEQRRIAAVLNAIQQDIAAQEDIIAEARAFKRSLMQRLFTYGPGPVPAETQETEIGEIPAHWEIVETGEIFEIQLGKMLSQKAKRGISSRPYLRNANVQWGYIDLGDLSEMDFNAAEMKKFGLRQDDILVCEGGEIGRTAIWENQMEECYYQKAIHRLRPKDGSLVLPRFFAYYMMLVFLVKPISIVEGASSTIAHLPVAKLRAVPAVLPPIDEQAEIVGQLEAADLKLAAEEDRRAALSDFFTSTLNQLMTGQIRLL